MTSTNGKELFDVVVIGSGAAGLSAALGAVAAGASVCVLERSDRFGGTTAMSGGVAWVPNNHLMADVGATDSREDALTYLERLSLGRTDRTLLETYVDEGPEVIRFLDRETPLDLHGLKFPDYHPEFPGGSFGRSLMPDVFDARTLGDYRPKLRMSPHFPVPISLLDMERAGAAGVLSDMDAILPTEKLMERMQNDFVASGTALAAGLLKAAIDKGVTLRTDMRVRSLLIEDGTVVGVSVEHGGETLQIGARRGVIIASGGYEYSQDLVRDFIRGPLEAPVGSPSNEGDGLLMAMEAGAAIGNMSEAWWIPVMQIPGEEYEGRPFFRLATNERAMPGSIMVNPKGKRFVNEAHNYNDIGRAFHSFDPVTFAFENLPAWMILHQPRLDRSAFLTRFPTDPIPNWLIQAPTIRELAAKIDIDPDALEATVARFNANVAEGCDPDFHRGESAYDFFHGDNACEGAWQTLGAIDTAPFYAIRVYSGTLGTKGGPKTNERAEVLNVRGGVIAGLYAAGNAMAGVTGMAYPGAGGTIGPALVFGHIAGRAAAQRTNRF
jgi:3-oxosteroid 1-dehydrogenase